MTNMEEKVVELARMVSQYNVHVENLQNLVAELSSDFASIQYETTKLWQQINEQLTNTKYDNVHSDVPGNRDSQV